MDAPTVALIAAVLSAAVISIGWIVTHFSTRWREIEARKVASAQAARTRHIELLLNHYQRQIEEFYVPLYSHIRLIWNIRKIQNRFVTGLPDKRGIIDRTLDSKYFSPLHEGIIEIFKTKLFLIEGADIPNSFTDYLAHSVTQRMQLRL